MRHLALIRHGEAVDSSPKGDHKRPLTSKGRDVVARLGSLLVSRGHEWDLIIHSDAVRAVGTTEILRSSFSGIECHKFASLYLAGFDQLLSEVAQFDQTRSILAVGHNPGWSDIAMTLTGSAIGLAPGDCALMSIPQDEGWVECLGATGAWQLEHVRA